MTASFWSSRVFAWDDSLGWWTYRPLDKHPYRVKKGVFQTTSERVVGVDLRKAASASELPFNGLVSLIVDGAAVNDSVFKGFFELPCVACSGQLEWIDGDPASIGCFSCGGMFDLETLRGRTPYPLAFDWGVRLEGRWPKGAEQAIAERQPRVLSAKGAQAERAAAKVAIGVELEALHLGRLGDDPVLALGEQRRLRDLRLWYSNITDASVRHACQYQSLESLNIGNNEGVTDDCAEALATLRAVRFLNLEQTSVGTKVLEAIADLPKLEHVALARTGIDEDAAGALKKHRPELAIAPWFPSG